MLMSFLSGLLLLMASYLASYFSRDKIHPSVVFPLVWGITLIALSLLPLIGFYEVDGNVLFIYIFGGLIFSITSLGFSFLYKKNISTAKVIVLPIWNINRLVWFFLLMNIVVFYFVIKQMMSIGSSIEAISYTIRRAAVEGEDLFNPFISNYMLLGLIVIPIMTAFLIKKQLSFLRFAAIALPWIILILIVSGRASLIQLVLVMFFMYYILTRKVSLKIILILFLFFLSIVVAGALSVSKVDVSGAFNLGDIIITFLQHISSYVFQGPILFSEYYNGNSYVSPNWSPFVSIQHIFSLFGLSSPPPPLHLEFNRYGYNYDMDGNVYSLYFSLYPNNGLLGTVFFIIIYSILTTYFYLKSLKGSLVYILISGYLFSAMVLSVFSDLFLTGLWFFIKLIIIYFLLKYFMNLRLKRYGT